METQTCGSKPPVQAGSLLGNLWMQNIILLLLGSLLPALDQATQANMQDNSQLQHMTQLQRLEKALPQTCQKDPVLQWTSTVALPRAQQRQALRAATQKNAYAGSTEAHASCNASAGPHCANRSLRGWRRTSTCGLLCAHHPCALTQPLKPTLDPAGMALICARTCPGGQDDEAIFWNMHEQERLFFHLGRCMNKPPGLDDAVQNKHVQRRSRLKLGRHSPGR